MGINTPSKGFISASLAIVAEPPANAIKASISVLRVNERRRGAYSGLTTGSRPHSLLLDP